YSNNKSIDNNKHFYQDTTRYPITDRRGDPYSEPNRNTFDLKDTAFVKRHIEYDPKKKQYYIIEKIGDHYYKTTTSFTMKKLISIKSQLQFGKLFITGVLANQRSQRQSLGLQGGTATQNFSIKADEYDENRHFLMAQYFRNNYNKAMKQLPVVNSAVQILK